jgi:triacylglycerol lipase
MTISDVTLRSTILQTCSFNPFTIQYCPQNALWLARCAGLVYREPDAIAQQVKAWGYPKFHFIDHPPSATQAFVMANDTVIVVVFRGTTCIDDWMTNKRIFQVGAFGGMVHRGFLRATKAVWFELSQKIKEFQDNYQPIMVTGHSLGGALATLTAARMYEEGMALAALYTYGSPRVGDTYFSEKFNANFEGRAYRFVNDQDIVTRIPPRALGYKHVGKFLYFDAQGELQDDPCFWEEFKKTVTGSLADFLNARLDCVHDHQMSLYEARLLQNLDRCPV